MLAFFALRNKEPGMVRPFKVPMFPLFPLTALVIASVAFIAMTYYNQGLALIFFAIVGISYVYFLIFLNKKM
ncbi:MAG: hypothetical protein E4H26_12495 [Flavobacteriales bacterium]|nr:MAG: hypothetical protein E4H26_12495 [Flavobacteriales bacterium]